MRHLFLFAALAFPSLGAWAQTAEITPLLTKQLPDIQGKEVVMLTVSYAPGASDPVHRHNAHVFVYVLEGAILMQVRGGEEVRLTPGQTFYEAPSDVHVVGRNASATELARFLVLFVKDAGTPVLVPAR
jgi:quercetin dioxygenase-like cupin family protein